MTKKQLADLNDTLYSLYYTVANIRDGEQDDNFLGKLDSTIEDIKQRGFILKTNPKYSQADAAVINVLDCLTTIDTTKAWRRLELLLLLSGQSISFFTLADEPKAEIKQNHTGILNNLTATQDRVVSDFIAALQALNLKPKARGSIKKAYQYLCKRYPDVYADDDAGLVTFRKHLNNAGSKNLPKQKQDDSLDANDLSLMNSNYDYVNED